MSTTGLPRTVAHPSAGVRLNLSYTLLGLVLVVDQLLLPMLHAGGVPFKVSYLLLGGAFVAWSLTPSTTAEARQRDADLLGLTLAMGAIIAAGILGELWMTANLAGVASGEAVRSVLIYLLVLLAFGLGQRAVRFDFRWLIWVLFVTIALNVAFIVLRTRLPGWLVDFYYGDSYVQGLANIGVRDIQDVLELARPRGLFGNPNASALMVNIIVLFLHLALRNSLLQIRSAAVGAGVVLLPILLAMALASRGEFLVAALLGFLNFRCIMWDAGGALRTRMIVTAVLGPLLGAIYLGEQLRNAGIADSLDRVVSIVAAVANAEKRRNVDDGASRPLLAIEYASTRFASSPLVGTGFGTAKAEGFDYETRYYHNDWLRLVATSGLVGLFAMFWILWRYAWPLGWPVLVPFVLPALVNTFMLNIPAFMFYFFMLGVFGMLLRRGAAGA